MRRGEERRQSKIIQRVEAVLRRKVWVENSNGDIFIMQDDDDWIGSIRRARQIGILRGLDEKEDQA
jgi:hypothetical protein